MDVSSCEGQTDKGLTTRGACYLQNVSDRILHEFSLPESQFYSASHECFLDIGAYGTSPVQISYVNGVVNFRARPLADVFFDTDMHGKVDTAYYRCFKTARQLMQMFPDIENMQGFNAKKSVHNKYELVYTVCPNQTSTPRRVGVLDQSVRTQLPIGHHN